MANLPGQPELLIETADGVQAALTVEEKKKLNRLTIGDYNNA